MQQTTNSASINSTKEHEINIFNAMIVSGPVIIQSRNGILKTLLVKHGNKPIEQLKWKFPGGKLIKNSSLKDNAIREAKEEIGVEVKITKSLPTLELWQTIPETGNQRAELIILVHYLAKINQEPIQGKEILAMRWFDINNLPNDCAPNIKPIIKAYKNL